MAMRKSNLFDPGSDLSPQKRKRRAKQQAERAQRDSDNWRQSWQPLPPSPPRVVRPGAMDFLTVPSLIGTRKDD
jgi:hypothetical protein